MPAMIGVPSIGAVGKHVSRLRESDTLNLRLRFLVSKRRVCCQCESTPNEELTERGLQWPSANVQYHAASTTQSGQGYPFEDRVRELPRPAQEGPRPTGRLEQLPPPQMIKRSSVRVTRKDLARKPISAMKEVGVLSTTASISVSSLTVRGYLLHATFIRSRSVGVDSSVGEPKF